MESLLSPVLLVGMQEAGNPHLRVSGLVWGEQSGESLSGVTHFFILLVI